MMTNLLKRALIFLPLLHLMATPITLQNDYWSIKLHPETGCKASSIIHRSHGKNLVNTWFKTKIKGMPAVLGGAWGGHMAGSHLDEQGFTPFQLHSATPTKVHSSWTNPYEDFNGLREDRTITLDGQTIRVALRITNSSTQKRTFLYRMQDFLGLVAKGQNQYGIVLGETPETFLQNDPQTCDRVFMKPKAGGLAACNFQDDFGLLVTCTGNIDGLFLWHSDADLSATVEFFLQKTTLAPGETWETTFSYQAFKPSAPSDLPPVWQQKVQAKAVYDALQQQMPSQTTLPYHAVCLPQLDPQQLQIFPVAASDSIAGKAFPTQTQLSLRSLKVFGTPGERVDVILALKAGTQSIRSPWTFSPFQGTKASLTQQAWDLHYLSQDGYYLVHDQKLTTQNSQLAVYGNSLKDTHRCSDLALEPQQTAWVKLSYQIPENAQSGNYDTTLNVAGQDLQLSLNIFPFQLKRDNAKAFGSFFAIFPNTEEPGWTMSRDDYKEALKLATANWNNSIVTYVKSAEDLRWNLKTIHDLGWKNSVICPIYRHLSSQEISKLEKQYGYRFLTWTVDEPSTYKHLKLTTQRLRGALGHGYRRLTFTPCTFMGMLYADLYADLAPIFNTNGLMTQLMALSRQYAAAKRTHFWYSCPTGMLTPKAQLQQRLLHGAYLWKAPVHGIFDWGETIALKPEETGGYCGYVGKRLVSTIRRDNNYEGYKDYLYLKTLAEAIQAHPQAPASAKAEAFLKNLADILEDNYFKTLNHVDHAYLNAIREQAAQLTADVLKAN